MKLPPFDWWRTVLFLVPAIAIYTVVLGTLSLVSSVFDRRGVAAHRCAQWWARLIVKTSGVRIERRGPLPPTTAGSIFVANHSSFFDIPILFDALPHQLRLMAKASLGSVPFIGWHLRRAGHLLVDRANPGAAIFKKMQRLAAQGTSLLVFPEAGRSFDGRLMPFKGGVFLLAIETGSPVVPVSVAGSRDVMPRGRLTVSPAKVDVIVHDPIETTGLSRDAARTLAARAQQIIASALPGQ